MSLLFFTCLTTMVSVVQADGNARVSVEASTGNLIISAGSKAVEVQAAGMSIGAISDVEGSINRCLADVEAQGTLLELVKSDLVDTEAAVGACKANVVSLQEAFGAMAVAATKYEAATDAELLAMNNDLGDLATELAATKSTLAAAQQAIKDLTEELADKTFSFGGFPHACTPFRTCVVGSHISEAGTASADVVCTPCEMGKTFSLKEDASACSECSTQCSKDNFVIDTQCTTTADITCKPSFNGFWAQQEVSDFDHNAGANGLKFNDLFDHKKVVLGENNNMEWCMQDEDGNGCQKPSPLSFDRSTGAFNPKTGMYTVPEDGIYSVVASVRMDYAKYTLIYLYADINNEYDKFQGVNTGNTADRPNYDNSIGKITGYWHEPSANWQTMKLSGLYMLKKGATLNIGFDWTRTTGYRNADPWKNAHVHPNTGFGVASLNSLDTTSAFTYRTDKWEGHNTNHNDWRVYTGKAILKSEGDILSTEQTNGLFNLGDDLAPQEGDSKWVYTVPSDGIYKFNLNFVMGCCGGSRLARGEYVVTAICVNSKDEPTKFGEEQCKGVSSIEGAPHRWSGTQMGAFLKLEKGQVVRMGWLPNFDAQGWNVRQQTTFSGIRLGDAPQRDDGKSPNGVVGFHAHKKAEQKVEKGWDKLTNYRASGWHGTTSLWNSGHFKADDGIFTAPESGVYISEAMQRFDGAPSGPAHGFRLLTCIDGGPTHSYQSGNGHTMRGDVPTSYFTLSFSAMYHMKKGQTAQLCSFATTGVTLNSGGWASGGLWSMYLLSRE